MEGGVFRSVRVGSTLTYDPAAIPLFGEARPYLKSADFLLDIGAGIRPQRFVEARCHVCLEPHGEYCEILRANGFVTIQGAAPAALAGLAPVDTVTAIDVIEHLTREDGAAALAEMVRLARKQVVIFTPLGYVPQDGGADADAWGYQGQRWQRHRSGWTPADFPGWRCFVDEKFHGTFGAFFAIWNRKQ